MAYLRLFSRRAMYFLKAAWCVMNREQLYSWYAFLFFVSFFSVLYMAFDKVFSLDDPFFHIRFAELLREKGVSALTNFQSIYFSRMGIGHEYLVYYNFLFYLILQPFTLITPLVVGMKLYGTLALSLSLQGVYLFLKKILVRNPFLWTIFFLIAGFQSNMVVRFSFVRPFTLAPIFLVAMLFCLYKRKYFLLGVISFAYFYWHTATFVFPFCLAFGYFLFEQFYGKKPDWKKLFFSGIGTIGAVVFAYVIFPGVVPYLRDVIFPVFFDTSITKDTGIIEGGEVYGRNFFTTFGLFFWFIFPFSIAAFYEIACYIRMKRGFETRGLLSGDLQPLRATLFMATLVFLLGASFSARFLDYFVYFCILYVAIVLNGAFRSVSFREKTFQMAFVCGVSLTAFFLLTSSALGFYESLGSARSHLTVQGPTEWLNTHIEKGSILFNVDWDSFPAFYYFTGNNFRYVSGLEPRFLYDLDQKMYWTWVHMREGFFCEKKECSALAEQMNHLTDRNGQRKTWEETQGNFMADSITKTFESEIIVVSVGNESLLKILDGSSRFKKEFFDKENSPYALYRVIPKK